MHRVTLVISILGSGGSVVFVRVVVPVVMEELPPCVGEEMLQKLS